MCIHDTASSRPVELGSHCEAWAIYLWPCAVRLCTASCVKPPARIRISLQGLGHTFRAMCYVDMYVLLFQAARWNWRPRYVIRRPHNQRFVRICVHLEQVSCTWTPFAGARTSPDTSYHFISFRVLIIAIFVEYLRRSFIFDCPPNTASSWANHIAL